jgi:opacity protein-like surface antigen
MRQKIAIAALAAALAPLAGAPALAGGLSEPAPAPMVEPAPVPVVAPSGDWGGGYAGVQLGYGDVSGDLDGYGGLYGVHAGYNWDLGAWVLGAELDYDAADLEIAGGPDSIDAVARLKLRAGYDAGPALLYATAGPARADATVGGASLDDSGWFAGLGVDYGLTQQWTVGAEVLAHQFDDFAATGLNVDATTATLRASFRF